MRVVSFTEFRKNASRLLDLVENGETIRVLRHGKPVATVVTASPEAREPAWKVRGIRLIAPGADLAEAILQDRK